MDVHHRIRGAPVRDLSDPDQVVRGAPERLPRFRPFEGSRRAIRYRISDLDAFLRPDGPSEARDSAIEAVA